MPVSRSDTDDVSAINNMRGTLNLKTSTRIARFLTAAVVAFVIVSVGFAFWFTREHNRLAATASEQMVRGGLAALVEKLKTVTMDFAIWPDAVRAIEVDDRVWIWENIGISAAVTETTDLMMIVPTGGSAAYGWSPGMTEEPSYDLLPDSVVETMHGLLDDIAISDRRAVSASFMVADDVWLLATARIVSEDPAQDPDDDAKIPRLIFGFTMDDPSLTALGQQYLIDDLNLSREMPATGPFIPLEMGGGAEDTFVTWSPPRPGDEILRSIAVPLAFSLGVLTVIALISSSLLSRSARRLEAAMVSAQSASRAKTDFIANVSHELRTPMNGIIGLARLLRQADLEERHDKMVDMLLSSSETQMTLIKDLLDVSNIENGQFTLNVVPFSPATELQTLCGIFQIEADEKGLKLDLNIQDPRQIQVLGDRERFQQICSNLLGNALKFTDEGAVHVRLRVRERLGQALIALEVADTGIGIAAEDQQRIFERFAQATNRIRGKAHGSGLGLAITKTIVDMMDGEITVESQPGKGAKFHVELALERVVKDDE